jgi:predicted MPP superfamily phosphohydrolase
MIVEKINAENPDLVLSAGDFVCGHTRHSTMPIKKIAKTLGKIKAEYYTTLGNHDGWYGTAEITKNLEKNGIKVLSNSNVGVNVNGQKLYIAGIEDYDTGEPNIIEALYGVEDNKPIIMLSHTPDMFPKMPNGITLVLAGHCHGGQIRIPLLGPIFTASRYGDKYAKGWKQEKDGKQIKINTSKPIKLQKDISTLFVTRGIGVSILPFRFNCPPEINVIEFQ